MKTRVAKAILHNIMWSGVLAGVACLLVLVLTGVNVDFEFYAWVATSAFTSGLIAFAFYNKTKVGRIDPNVARTLNVLAWSILLALFGGIGVTLLTIFVFNCVLSGECGLGLEALVVLGSPYYAFMSGMITFALYEASKRFELNRKQRDKSHHPVRH